MHLHLYQRLEFDTDVVSRFQNIKGMDQFDHFSADSRISLYYGHFANRLDIQPVLLLNFQLFLLLAECILQADILQRLRFYLRFLLKCEVDVSKPSFYTFWLRMCPGNIVHFPIEFNVVSIFLEISCPISKFRWVQTYMIIPGFDSIIFPSRK